MLRAIAMLMPMCIGELVVIGIWFYGFPVWPTAIGGGLLAGLWGVFAEYRLSKMRERGQ